MWMKMWLRLCSIIPTQRIPLQEKDMTGADLIADTISKHGLKRVYTFPGGTIAPVFDALGKKNIDIFCARHEQGAGYAALAVARLTGEPQVVMVTSGPGATNLVTVVADAYFDSTPLIVVAGQVGTGDVNSGRPVRQSGFQQVDTTAIMEPICKAAFLPLSPQELPDTLAKAFALAVDGRPGPVVVDLPMDVQRAELDKETSPTHPTRYDPQPAVKPDPDLIEQAARMLSRAQRPVLLAGQGVLISQACPEIRTLAESNNFPVVMSLLGLGAFPTGSPLALGFLGHTGNQYANRSIHESDLLLVVGARLDLRQTGTCIDQFVPHGKVIRIDIDKDELDYPRVRSDLDIHADAKLALARLIQAMEGEPLTDLSAWWDSIDDWKTRFPLLYDSDHELISPQSVIATVNQDTQGRSIIAVSGVGAHQQWCARHFDFDFPRRVWLTSGGHGAMGYDLPASIGAQVARPHDLVVCFVGDGSFQINIQELQTAVDYNTPIKIFILDNQRLGLVSQFQLFNWDTDPTTGAKVNPDFSQIARGYGLHAQRIERREEMEAAVSEAISYDGPALVHCLVDQHEDITPLLLPNQTMDSMWPYV